MAYQGKYQGNNGTNKGFTPGAKKAATADRPKPSHYMRLSKGKGNSVVVGNLYPSKDGTGLQVKVSAKVLEALAQAEEGSYLFINPSKFAEG